MSAWRSSDGRIFWGPGSDFLIGTNENDTFSDFLGGQDEILGRGGFDTLDARFGFGQFELVDFQLTDGLSLFSVFSAPIDIGDPPPPPEVSIFSGI